MTGGQLSENFIKIDAERFELATIFSRPILVRIETRIGRAGREIHSSKTELTKGAAEGHSLSARQESQDFQESENAPSVSTYVLTLSVHNYVLTLYPQCFRSSDSLTKMKVDDSK